MPLDPMMSDAMLNPFRNMVTDCESKNSSGELFEELKKLMQNLESLAQKHDDINAFNGEVMQGNLYIKFSDLYGRILSQHAASEQESKGYDDATLLKQTLDALRNAITALRESKQMAIEESKGYDPKAAFRRSMEFIERQTGKKGGMSSGAIRAGGGFKRMIKQGEKAIDNELEEKPAAYDNSVEIDVNMKTEWLVKPIEELIALGEEPGMTLPRFLRIQIEKGMDKAMEGSAVVRDSLDFSYQNHLHLGYNPHQIEREKKKLECFDLLAKDAAFGIPNTDELKYSTNRIDYEFDPAIQEWEEIISRWESLLYDLSLWSLSYVSFAPQIEPWALAKNPHAAVIETQKTQPGIFRQKEKLLKKYFGMDFSDIFKHPTFEWNVKQGYLGESQEKLEFLIEKVYPECLPFRDLSAENTSIRADLYKGNREINPAVTDPAIRWATYYDSRYGQGRYASKYGQIEKVSTNAKPWNWESFRYK